jgi:hypothetical protein
MKRRDFITLFGDGRRAARSLRALMQRVARTASQP